MVICVAVTKFLGIIWIIPLTPLIGSQGLGIYSNAYAMYTILQQLATSGFPLAMGKLISERAALEQHTQIEQIYRVTLRSVFVLGAIAFLIMWFGSPLYSTLVAARDSATAVEQMVPSMRALSLMLLVIPVLASYRGYLQGFQQLDAPAYSQAIEQLFRVISMVVGTYLVMRVAHQSVAIGAAAATFGGFVGGVAGLVLLIVAVRPIRKEYRGIDLRASHYTNREVLRMIYRVALPVSLGGLVVPIANLADSVTVTNLLMTVHETLYQAESNYGILTRQALYLIQLPLSFAYAIGVSVLPAISEAKALRRQTAIQSGTINTLRTMFFITFPTSAVLIVVARPIDYVLSRSYSGAGIITAVSFMCIFSSLELISTYILQGLGKMYRPVRNMFLGVIIKTMLNVILILTTRSVMGAAIATTIGYLFSSTLNVLAVKKYGRVHFSTLRLASPFFWASLPTAAAMFVVHWGFNHVTPQVGAGHGLWFLSLLDLLVSALVGAVVYLFVTLRIGAIREDELKRLPGIGRRLARLANRWYRVRRA